ncbi:hypothetical protein N7520_003438 [Penicillium odoratum]|uniref:uncharacterized protein n=1 Tax=Penicillium odoratum TaxID=1167516 RepID=UPI002549AD57|nr:uncharacterized protein N7520_003438 [Penicillium odoratum]KAJ5768879.1 hypothetical protein N7520_003438 [Penicillium odoratum]
MAQQLSPVDSPLMSPSPSPRKICVIGGGIAGVCLVHELAKKQDPDIPLQITIFERESYIGGRMKQVFMYDEAGKFQLDWANTGAQSFDVEDIFLAGLGRDVGIKFEIQHPHVLGAPLSQVNVWDGERLIPQELERLTITDIYERVMWRVFRSHRFWAQLAVDLREIWEGGYEHWVTIGEEATLGRDGFDKDALTQFARKWGISRAPQQSPDIRRRKHSFLELVVRKAGAIVSLQSTVTKIKRLENNTFQVSWLQQSTDKAMDQQKSHLENFDAVVLAHAFGQTDIDFDPPLPVLPEKITYTPLHVTHFISNLQLDPVTFNLRGKAEVPDLIWNLEINSNTPRFKNKVPPFLTIQRSDRDYLEGCEIYSENVYRVVSTKPFSDQNITSLLEHNGIARKHVTFPDQVPYPVLSDLAITLPSDYRLHIVQEFIPIRDFDLSSAHQSSAHRSSAHQSRSDANIILSRLDPVVTKINPTVRGCIVSIGLMGLR